MRKRSEEQRDWSFLLWITGSGRRRGEHGRIFHVREMLGIYPVMLSCIMYQHFLLILQIQNHRNTAAAAVMGCDVCEHPSQ